MVSLSRPLACQFWQSQGWKTKGQLVQILMPKCEHRKCSKYILMIGNIRTIANFDVREDRI